MWVFRVEDGRYLAVNEAACKRYGYSETELLGMTVFDIRSPTDVPKVKASLANLSAGGELSAPHVWEHRTKNGHRLFVEVLSTIIEIDSVKACFSVLRDVTAEQELRAAQERFFELAQDVMVIRTLEGELIHINPAATRILGWSVAELASMKPLDLIHGDDHQTQQSNFDAFMRQPGPRRWDARVRAKDGTYRWFEWSGTIDFHTERAYAVARDVSEAREIHERLRKSESGLAWAQEASHLGSWSYEASTGLFNLSDEYYRITGYEPGGYEPTWENIMARVHPEDVPLVNVSPASLSPDRRSYKIEIRLVRPNGDVRTVLSYYENTFNLDGSIHSVNGTIWDVTDQKNAQEIHKWLAEIVASSSDAIIGKSLDGIVLSWNNAAERLYGYSATEMIGESIQKLIPPHYEGELDRILSRLRKGERVQEFETERMDCHGRIFEVAVTISPIQTEDGRVIGAATIARDISARKETERQLANRLAQLTALRTIDLSITGTFELPLTLEIVVTQTLATTNVDSACIFVFDCDSGETLLVSTGSASGNPIGVEQLQVAVNLAQQAVETQSVTSYRLVTGDFEYEARPFIAKGKAYGALVISHGNGTNRSDEQARFLEALTGQAAIAVESARLFEDIRNSREALERAYDETLEGWSRALDLRDHETEGHSRRVTELTSKLAARIGLPEEVILQIRRGALLHDIGKLGVPDSILSKPGPLTDAEWIVMRKHPQFGRDILAPIAFLQPALEIPYCHHEKWDGSGYPQGLREEEIPLSARIFALADVWDALVSDRPYRKGWTVERVIEHIRDQAGRHFDPALVPIFLEQVQT